MGTSFDVFDPDLDVGNFIFRYGYYPYYLYADLTVFDRTFCGITEEIISLTLSGQAPRIA